MADRDADSLAYGADHDGLVRHAKPEFRMGFPIVEVAVKMTNRGGNTVVTSRNEIALPD